jgi:hypothetical protein
MNVKLIFKNFHLKNRDNIASLAKQFTTEDFFVTFPELKNEVSLAITGSTASGFQDEHSDLDLAIFFKNQQSFEKYKFLIIENYRNDNNTSVIEPIEFHGGNIKSFDDLENELQSWSKDWLLREISDAIILYDPENTLQKIKEKYLWYPIEMYNEKMNALFAEATFLIFNRYQLGMQRQGIYYIENVKIRTMGLLLTCLVMLGKKYPKSEKHLQKDVENIKSVSSKILNTIENILTEKNSKEIFSNLCLLRKEIEKILIEEKTIPQESNEYWMGLRPTQKVDLGK